MNYGKRFTFSHSYFIIVVDNVFIGFYFYLRMHELWIFPYGMRLACIQKNPPPPTKRNQIEPKENYAITFFVVEFPSNLLENVTGQITKT